LIQTQWGVLDNNLSKKEYAFNYWVLTRIYDIDEEVVPDLITEYNDKSIDTYVHFEESKELYLIQNKYYDQDTIVDRRSVTDFLTTSLVCLNERNYKRSKDLQMIFDEIKDDPEYKVFLHFFVSNNKKNEDTNSNIKNLNNYPSIKINAFLRAEIFYLNDIQELYYGQSYKENIAFKFSLTTKVKSNMLRILPEQYDMPEMSKAYYILTPIARLHQMNIEAKERKYPLFEENIRDYLGKSTVNKGIIQTLKNANERNNFFYYNNGVTIICKNIIPVAQNTIEMTQPQIINGCQTVNSITSVLSDYTKLQIDDEFKNVYVMVKALLFDATVEANKPQFYRDIVKYTNRQNAINENAFGAKKNVFYKIQEELKDRGFLLLVKPSDKNYFGNEYSKDAALNPMLKKAQHFYSKIGYEAIKVDDLMIPLEKLLQVFLSFIKDGYYGYTKKNVVLKPTSEIYNDYSINLHKYLTNDNLIRLYLLYVKAERKRSESIDKKTPIPYYLIGFLGHFIKDKQQINAILYDLFETDSLMLTKVFTYLEKLTTRYKKEVNEEYNVMIKRPIDETVLEKQIDLLNDFYSDDEEIIAFFSSLESKKF
jgi:hypothetical protein